MCAILQLVSAPLNPIPIAEHFRRSHPQCEHSYGQHIYMSKENVSTNSTKDGILLHALSKFVLTLRSEFSRHPRGLSF